MSKLLVIYDGDCPFCRSYISLLRLRAQHDVQMVDARKDPVSAARYGLDLNEGMIVDLDGSVYHGSRAVSLLSRLSRTPGPLRFERLSSIVYPVLRLGRSLTLRLLGRRPF